VIGKKIIKIIYQKIKSFSVSLPDEYLQTATRKLTIDELHQRVPDLRSLYQEFWVCKIK
jgi:hypothetical protein